MLHHSVGSARRGATLTNNETDVRDFVESKLVSFVTLAKMFQDVFGASLAKRALGGMRGITRHRNLNNLTDFEAL